MRISISAIAIKKKENIFFETLLLYHIHNNIKNKEAKYHAIDLGIAMQITNICRDINEDFLMNRVYLPKDKISKDEIYNHDNDKIYEVTSDLIRLSNDYYSSALEGVKYIPLG